MAAVGSISESSCVEKSYSALVEETDKQLKFVAT